MNVAEELRHCTRSWIGNGHTRTSPGLVFVKLGVPYFGVPYNNKDPTI